MASRGYVPLALVPPGSVVRLVEVQGGHGVLRRLFELGILPGVEFRVVFNGAGPTVIERNGARLALGRGIAMRLLVEVVQSG
ncbi:FeoA family protein [Thermofilum pendens]|uniref:FeoA family protein n=1 Tax=Thermofilum pendens (strain DSM 2475 / Hrk 5) TaxID=368408 RepID=A1RYH0_THEPD|nr:FeoA family protein [Thermofilum pendens]ABL78250.1 FeoA family protein [Thermofilum pendens Hrk 5]